MKIKGEDRKDKERSKPKKKKRNEKKEAKERRKRSRKKGVGRRVLCSMKKPPKTTWSETGVYEVQIRGKEEGAEKK